MEYPKRRKYNDNPYNIIKNEKGYKIVFKDSKHVIQQVYIIYLIKLVIQQLHIMVGMIIITQELNYMLI